VHLSLHVQVSEPLAQGMAKFEGIMKAYKATLRDEHSIYCSTPSCCRAAWEHVAQAKHQQMHSAAPLPCCSWPTFPDAMMCTFALSHYLIICTAPHQSVEMRPDLMYSDPTERLLCKLAP
jgi:hypothetical protein